MKILHTSDWHLGHVLYGYDRYDEFEHFFARLVEILRWEVPDVLVVSGDIFDISNPSASVARLFKDSILRLREILPDMSIVITAGNHDSASRIDIDRNLWKAGGIHVFGGVERNGSEYDFSQNIVKVGDKGYVVGIPFVNRAFMPRTDKDLSPERSFFKEAEKAVEKINIEGRPVVLMAHIAVEGCDSEGHRLSPIGGFDTVSLNVFGDTWSYVALGHIHKAQMLGGEGRVAYSGSPLAISFDEPSHHYVFLVNIDEDSVPEIQKIEINPLRPLITLPSEPVDFKRAIRLLSKFPEKEKAYIRLNVAQSQPLPVDCQEQAVAKTKDKECRFCTIKYTDTSEAVEKLSVGDLKIFEFTEIDPIRIAESYLRQIGESEERLASDLKLLTELIDTKDDDGLNNLKPEPDAS